MAQLSKGHVFTPGEVVDPADLNNLVDSATALAGLITDPTHPAVDAQAGDKVLVSRGGFLKQADVSTFPSGVTGVNATSTPAFSNLVASGSGTRLITLSFNQQAPGKVLAGPVSGSDAVPFFRVLSPADMPYSTRNIDAFQIDWNLSIMFIKQLTSPSNPFAFTNASPGQTIRVLLYQDATGGRTVTWHSGTVKWPGGTNPVMSPGPQKIDIYTFHFIGGVYYGTFDQAFAL